MENQFVIMGMDFNSVPFSHLWESETAAVTALFFFSALIYASVQDIRTKEIGNYIHVIIAITAFIGFKLENLPFMLLGGIITALPMFLSALIKPGNVDAGNTSVGGGDIKLMAASGLILGAGKGIIALIVGLFLGIVCTFIYRKIKNTDLKTSFPFVPYLAAGCVFVQIIINK